MAHGGIDIGIAFVLSQFVVYLDMTLGQLQIDRIMTDIFELISS
jgi:hypothetical protein